MSEPSEVELAAFEAEMLAAKLRSESGDPQLSSLSLSPHGEPLPPPRILNVTPEQYHKLPGLSPSIAHVLLTRCGAIAWDQYQRKLAAGAVVEPDGESDDESPAADDGEPAKVDPEKQKRMDRGDVMHHLLLGKGKPIVEIPMAQLSKNGSYGTKRSKELRDAARKNGNVPVKERDLRALEHTAGQIIGQLATAGHVMDGVSEFAIEWWEPTTHGAVQCRTMMDHLRLFEPNCAPIAFGAISEGAMPSMATVYELKLPDDASPERSERTAEQLGYSIAAAARLIALNALFPSLAGRIEYRYLICETRRPWVFWDPSPTGSYLELGRRRWRTAVNQWASGLKSGRWLGYHDDIMRRQIDLPRWRKIQEGFADDE